MILLSNLLNVILVIKLNVLLLMAGSYFAMPFILWLPIFFNRILFGHIDYKFEDNNYLEK